MRPQTRDRFTIAIICALPLEAEAVESLFDETYDRLGKYYGKHQGDANAYINGRIGKHNVVLCYMPGMGKAGAASVASCLQVSYPGIELALVVGICGGTPRPSKSQEIFLGDVIISDCVIEYDFGRQYPGGFQRKMGVNDTLGRPSRRIRTLLNGLRTPNTSFEFHAQAQQYLRILQQRKPKWCHPRVNDVLFQASYVHKHHYQSPTSCQYLRLREPFESSLPCIHFGTVVSADIVMKSGQHRDEIVKREKAIGFEMEGAGVWDNISAYAAATGASVMKAFLEYWSPASDQVSGYSDRHKACLASLCITNPEEDLNRLKRVKGNRTSGTFGWFLESEIFRSWCRPAKSMTEREQNLLWLYGNPGVGKSTMAMTLVEELQKKDPFIKGDSILSFFFCDSGSESHRNVISMMRVLLYQIVKQCPPGFEAILSKYDVQGERLFTSFDSLWTLLMEICRVPSNVEIYCIIDALDECENESQETLLRQINLLFKREAETSLAMSSLHFLIISRPCIDLGSCKEMAADLRTMTQDKVQDLARRKNYSNSVTRRVSQILEAKANGTFLWVGIACKELEQVPSSCAVETLRTLPSGLSELYQALFRAAFSLSSPDNHPRLELLLAVVTFALRPLTIAEISDACRLYLHEDLDSRLQFTREIIDLCRLLVVVDNGYVRLLHASVQDFLMIEMHGMKAANANHAIATRCIEVIFGTCRPGTDRSALQPTYGLLGYSVLHWPQHASLARTEFTVRSEHERFFHDALGTWRSWLDNYNHLKRVSWSMWGIIPMLSTLSQEELEAKNARGQSLLLIAAENNQLEAMRVLIKSGARVGSLNDNNQNALHVLCKNHRSDDSEIIGFLLDKGICPYACDKDNMTPFLYAIGEHDQKHARAFLRNGFDLENRVLRRDWHGRTAMGILMPTHQPKESPMAIDSGLTALHFCAMNAWNNMTAFLLEWKADPNACSDLGQLLGRPTNDAWATGQYSIDTEAAEIYQTIDSARIQIVETLLESKSINHVIDFSSHYALSILDKLVGKGADISRPNHAHRTCFHLATKAGNLDVVRKCLNEGHDIMLQDADGLCPLHYAVSHHHLDILRLMAEICGDVVSEACHSLDHFGKSPLHHKLSDPVCFDEDICFLIQLGCDVNQPDEEGNSPLGLYLKSSHLSAERGIFWLLVLEGANTRWFDKQDRNLVHLLMHKRGLDEVILEILFQLGVDPTATDKNDRTFMHYGAMHGVFTKELVEFLGSRGLLDLDAKDNENKTPLSYAEEGAHRESPKNPFLKQHGLWEASYANLKAMSRVFP
ncbi:ankyrin repeat-containing domain protein [Aspergillus karnatakaensis]|uniref:Pfs, NACHT, and Ankyrin domain protein n=1 Tax=Aspergillus karnatakaensis TaxID=1810916 RepID=UPI003CCE2634